MDGLIKIDAQGAELKVLEGAARVLNETEAVILEVFDGALAQLDMAFVRQDGLFRKSHVFATPEQRKSMHYPSV